MVNPVMPRCLAELWPTKFVDVAGRRLVVTVKFAINLLICYADYFPG